MTRAQMNGNAQKHYDKTIASQLPTKRPRGRPPKGTSRLDLVDLPSKGTAGPPWDHGERRPDGQPWFDHPLFPINRTDPETQARVYLEDLKCAKFGGDPHPSVLTFLRWDKETAQWIENAQTIDLSTCRSVADFVKRFGGGRFQLLAWTYMPSPSGEGRRLVMTRNRVTNFEELEDEDEEEDEEEGTDEEEEEESPDGEPLQVKLARLEIEKMKLQFAQEQTQQAMRNAEADKKATEERLRLESYYAAEKQRDREHQKAMMDMMNARNAPSESSLESKIMGALLPKLTQGALAVISGGGEDGGMLMKAAISGLNKIAVVAGNVAMPLAMAKAKQWGLGDEVLRDWASSPVDEDLDEEPTGEGGEGGG